MPLELILVYAFYISFKSVKNDLELGLCLFTVCHSTNRLDNMRVICIVFQHQPTTFSCLQFCWYVSERFIFWSYLLNNTLRLHIQYARVDAYACLFLVVISKGLQWYTVVFALWTLLVMGRILYRYSDGWLLLSVRCLVFTVLWCSHNPWRQCPSFCASCWHRIFI